MLRMIFPDAAPELCADGIALTGDGAFLVGSRLVTADELEAVAAQPRPVNPGLTTLVPLKPPVLTWPHLLTYLEMQPSRSLDKAVFYLPPAVVGSRSLSDLGRHADELRMPVQFPAAQLLDEAPDALVGAADRVSHLDRAGTPVAPADADFVQVEPLNRRGADAYADVGDDLVPLTPAQRLFRLVHMPEGVQLGQAPGLVAQMLRRLPGGPVQAADPVVAPEQLGDRAFEVAGVTEVHTPEGYADLRAGLRDLPRGGSALVVVEHGNGVGVFQVTHDPLTESLMQVDVATGAPGLLPNGADRIRYGQASAEQSFLGLLNELRQELYATTPTRSWASATTDGQHLLQWRGDNDAEHSVEVIGSTKSLPAVGRTAHQRIDDGTFQSGVMKLAELSGRSLVVLGVDRPGQPMPLTVSNDLAARVGVHALDGDVPLVVTNGTVTADLRAELDRLHADLVYQAPGMSTGGGLNLGAPPWAVRTPGAADDEVAVVADELDDSAIVDAVREKPAPAVEAPAHQLSALITTPLTAGREELDRLLNGVRDLGTDQRPAATALAGLTTAFRPQVALLNLDHVGGREGTLRYLAEPATPGAVLNPLRAVPETATPAEREIQVRQMLPELAALAEHGLNDQVSTTITSVMDTLFAGAMTEADARTRIFTLAGQLANEPAIRGQWVTALNDVARVLPQHVQTLTWVVEAIIDCP
ncbi:hypothetical protein [Micromonospora sp. WMMD1155]|uniref:hypothetical protein n=1 Tax=Micromonospora sp. WMMD1155 TaxID=3016094 RepID=UPI00249ACB5A|nr:hypothetical protein [Micromonospora sp. WMMD1155]WFE48830.1 hypothetical protein O7617_00180 [Micromonospora sp. WMMD1155]